MSPTCIMTPKETLVPHKSKLNMKSSRCKSNRQSDRPMNTKETKRNLQDCVYVDLDVKCSCSPSSKVSGEASIQFSRRYLQCQSSMPIGILRSYVQQILPHSSMTQVSFYDCRDRLLNDDDALGSLRSSTPPSSHIPIRFTLLNRVTFLGHCPCSSSIEEKNSSPSSSSAVIKRETIDKALSTCSFGPAKSFSPCSSSSPKVPSESISIVNLLTPPSPCRSPPRLEGLVRTGSAYDNDRSIIDEITSQFGEICPPLPKKRRTRPSKKLGSSCSSNVPLDLSLKKRSASSFDFFSSQTKWIKT